MSRASKLLVVGIFGLVAALSCSSSDLKGGTGGSGGSGQSTGGSGTGGVGGVGGSCQYQHYFSPACGADASPRCTGAGGACYSLACGCNGKVIVGCGPEFAEPYAYTIPVTFDGGDSAGMTCDPNARDGGSHGDAGQVDAGQACSNSNVAGSCLDFECGKTWADVLANPVCVGVLPGQISEEHRADCGPYHVRFINHVDSEEIYYYDATSGALVALYSGPGSTGRVTCFAGPPAGVTAACLVDAIPSASWTQICEVDGGVVSVLPRG